MYLEPPTGMNEIDAQEFLRNEIPGLKPELNHVYRPEAGICKGDSCSWHEGLINWRKSIGRCGKGVRVGVLDTGVNSAHPALRGQNIRKAAFREKGLGRSPQDHGTAISALLVGNPESKTPGLIPGARLYAADVFFEDDEGRAAADTRSLLRGLDWLARKKVKFINISLSGPANEILANAMDKLRKQGIVVIAAAGNSGPGSAPRYPAAYPSVIAVTAVDKWLKPYRKANRGEYIDIAGPGVGIRTASLDKKTYYRSGTSYATPFVTAALAVSASARNSAAEIDSVLNTLSVRDLGQHGRDPVFGLGLVMAPTSCGAN